MPLNKSRAARELGFRDDVGRYTGPTGAGPAPANAAAEDAAVMRLAQALESAYQRGIAFTLGPDLRLIPFRFEVTQRSKT